MEEAVIESFPLIEQTFFLPFKIVKETCKLQLNCNVLSFIGNVLSSKF